MSDAIEWYRSALTTPIPSDPREVNAILDGKPIAPSAFSDDPAWPAFGVLAGSDLLSNPGAPGDPAPFMGSVTGSMRMHRRFGDNTGFETLTADAAAIDFLKHRVHVDLADYSEYLGSLALVIPDPVLRRVQHFVVPSDGNGMEKLVYRLVPRAGQTLNDLSLTLLERRADLLSRFEMIRVPNDGLIIVPCIQPVQASGYIITHPIHGVLAYQAPEPFIRSIQLSLGIVGRQVRVDAPRSDSPQSETASYNIAELSHEQAISIGKTLIQPAITRIEEAGERRARRAQARRYDQTWFDHGQRSAALTFIRGRISRARRYVLVADPYFGGRQVMQFLHAVPRIEIAFTIITSHLGFEGDESEIAGAKALQETARPKSELEERRLDEFAAAMATLKKRGIKSASAFVLVGKNLPLHDRFLVVDDVVWFLGNSLNALGERASLILQVPDGEPIMGRLRRMEAAAPTFEDYAKRRRKTSSARKRGD